MTERPILFSGAMVRAILDGRKTQTRRVVKPQPSDYTPGPNVHAPRHPAAYFDAYRNAPKTDANPKGISARWCWWTPDDRQGPDWIRCPYGVPGDRLWVRETWGYYGGAEYLYQEEPDAVGYRADHLPLSAVPGGRWRPSIHMPRWASRLTLDVTGVRVERLHDISEEDARAEGAEPRRPAGAAVCLSGPVHLSHVVGFRELWTSINGTESWDANPWVWVVEFRRAEVRHG